MYTPQQFEIIVNTFDQLPQNGFEELLTCFPFSNMLNISILDFESMRLHIHFLKKLSKFDIFYKFREVVTDCWEFILMNLRCLENITMSDILFNLLELLNYLISRMKALTTFTSYLLKQRERVFNTLASVTKLKLFMKSHVSICMDIINDLIEMDGPLPQTVSKNLADIAEICTDFQVVHELLILSRISLTKFSLSTELFNVCIPWFLKYGPGFLVKNYDEVIISVLLNVILELYVKYNYGGNSEIYQRPFHEQFEVFASNLKKVSHRIISFSETPILRTNSLKILTYLISEYNFNEMGIKDTHDMVLEQLLQFPTDVEKWPSVRSDMFFYICSYLCTHNCLLWKSSEVLNSMSELIYSYDRFTINVTLLKSLCYIYPFVLSDVSSTKVTLLGDELLIILSKFPYSFSNHVTYHVGQLVWILKRGCVDIKKQILGEWLKRDKDLDLLGKVISHCRAGKILLDIIIDWRCDELASKKATEICRRINDKELSENIAYLIPTSLYNKTVMDRLILSNPGVPDDTKMALKLCEFMSLILLYFEDMAVLRAACNYSKYLVTSLRQEENVVSIFCKNMKNIRFLAVKIKYVDEDTAIAILGLLRVLILVQKRNKIMPECEIETDFAMSLLGSVSKTSKCLELLKVIVTSHNVFIKLDKSNIQNVFSNLFNTSRDPSLATISFTCLNGILKMNESLARLHSTNVFIELQCSLSISEESGPEFLTFLITWMTILYKYPPNTFCLPDKRIVSNYIRRSGFISQKKLAALLQLLDKINIFPANLETKNHGFLRRRFF